MFPTLYRMQAKVKKRMNKRLPNNFRHAEFISKRYYELYFRDSSMKPVGMNPGMQGLNFMMRKLVLQKSASYKKNHGISKCNLHNRRLMIFIPDFESLWTLCFVIYIACLFRVGMSISTFAVLFEKDESYAAILCLASSVVIAEAIF